MNSKIKSFDWNQISKSLEIDINTDSIEIECDYRNPYTIDLMILISGSILVLSQWMIINVTIIATIWFLGFISSLVVYYMQVVKIRISKQELRIVQFLLFFEVKILLESDISELIAIEKVERSYFRKWFYFEKAIQITTHKQTLVLEYLKNINKDEVIYIMKYFLLNN